MRIGVALPHYGREVSLEKVVRIARECERLGFDSVWVSDHIVFDLAKYGGSDEVIASLDPLATLAVLSAETEKLRLGTMVLCNEFRHPLMVAKQAALIDRLELGIGAGWYEREFKVSGIDYPSVGARMGRLGESVQIIAQALSGETVKFRGKHYQVDGFVLGTKADVPLWVGGKGDQMLKLIAKLGASVPGTGWNAAWFQEPADYRARADVLGDDRIPRSIGQYAEGSAHQMVDRLKSFQAEGVGLAVMCFSEVPFGLDDEADLARFAQDVLPHVR